MLWPVSIPSYSTKPNHTPDLIGFDVVAAEFMPTVRRVVNQKPCLLGAKTKEVGAVSEGAMKERGRRVIERDYLLKLSRYYPRVKGQWSRGDLITKGQH